MIIWAIKLICVKINQIVLSRSNIKSSFIGVTTSGTDKLRQSINHWCKLTTTKFDHRLKRRE